MYKKIHTLEASEVLDYYLGQKEVSRKHKKNIRRIRNSLVKESKLYQKLAVSGQLHKINGMISNIDDSSKRSLSLLYKNYLNPSGVRSFIFKQSLYCVGCQNNYATDRATKDHFLPSSNYPNFFVLPWNLVPTCGDCNRIKNNVSPISKSDNLPHPYFNPLIFKKNWLKVVVQHVKPLKYEFVFDEKLSASEKQMVINHLIAYELEDVFLTHISTLFDEEDEEFKEIFKRQGSNNLKKYIGTLRDKAFISPSKLKRYWPINIEHAFFSGLHDSKWFCGEYYR